ncbi:hypothetical protein CDAR_30431 [Caerostris darwini]|uniref:Uncharacterized protein n=1 Tax=Caerostris darwini TaxID=1538125 RepID=A0AAV4VXH2_9ARAC|nr:hypothetical protein CDAR_30431 [Caerostris darwini]
MNRKRENSSEEYEIISCAPKNTSYAHGGGEGGERQESELPSNDLTQIHNGASAATLPAFYPQECSSNPRLHIFARSEGSARNFPTLIWHSSGAGSLNFQDYKHGFSQSGFFRNLTRWIPGFTRKLQKRHDFAQVIHGFPPLSVRRSIQAREDPRQGPNW